MRRATTRKLVRLMRLSSRYSVTCPPLRCMDQLEPNTKVQMPTWAQNPLACLVYLACPTTFLHVSRICRSYWFERGGEHHCFAPSSVWRCSSARLHLVRRTQLSILRQRGMTSTT